MHPLLAWFLYDCKYLPNGIEGLNMPSRRDVLIAGLGIVLVGCGGGDGAPSPVPAPAPPPVLDNTPLIPQAISGDWDVDSPASQGVSQLAVNQMLLAAGTVSNVRGLVVARNGRLIAERYYNNYAMGDLQHVRSITKSVASMLVGQALQAGAIPSVNSTVASLLPEAWAAVHGSQAGSLTLEQILTMRTGVVFNDNTQWDALAGAPDSVRFVLGLPVGFSRNFHYDSAGSHLPSAMLQRARGLPLDALARRDLFEPLGITQYAWTKDALGVPFGSFGLQLRTRDTAKLAQLVLDGGMKNGQQVVPSAWLTSSTAVHVKPAYSQYDALVNVGYGYLWWSGTLGGKSVVLGWGYGGQFAVIVRQLNMVIQTNAFHSVDGPLKSQQEQGLLLAIAKFLESL